AAASRRIVLDSTTRWLFTAPPAFDISLLEMLGPLWVGGSLEVVCAPTHKDPVALLQLLENRPEINTLQATPASWRVLLQAGWSGQATATALAGGEAPDAPLAARRRGCGGQRGDCCAPAE